MLNDQIIKRLLNVISGMIESQELHGYVKQEGWDQAKKSHSEVNEYLENSRLDEKNEILDDVIEGMSELSFAVRSESIDHEKIESRLESIIEDLKTIKSGLPPYK